MASTWGTNTWGSNEWQDNVITVSLTAPESASALGTPQSFNVEGWGRQSYGNSGWGVEYSVKPSGVSATTSLGTVEASQIITVELTGLEANSNLGLISINSEVTLSSQSATVSLGTTESFNETGWGRLTWNTADWGEGADETISVTGFEATASPGSITPAFTYLLEMVGANHSMTTSVGTVVIDAERGVPVTGVEATFATPTLSYAGTLVGWGRDGWSDLSWGESPDQVIPLVGREATASVGSLTPADVIGLSGQEATTSVGSFSFVISPNVSLTGQQSTINQGTLGLEFGPASISGVSSTASLGTLGLEFGPAEITGVSATTSIGTLEIGPVTLVDLTGVAATPAVGSLTPADVVGLTGISATSATGSIAPADVVGLSLDAINALQGEGGVQAFANINTGSNGSFSNIDTGSNTSYSNPSTGSNSSYSDQSTGSNSSYSNVATGSNTSYNNAA